MKCFEDYCFWFLCGSQHLYGSEVIDQVRGHAICIAEKLNQNGLIPGKIVFKAVLTTNEQIKKVCEEANADSTCGGVILWMHTFSPSKMWIPGLKILNKPILHLHTQFNREIPWDSIDMDFMNLNQAAHGDREHGFIAARMRLHRKVISGYWEDDKTVVRIAGWMRSAVGAMECRTLKVARFGDNMRDVAVTEGDKVEAEIKLGWNVSGYGIGDLACYIDRVSDKQLNERMDSYLKLYELGTDKIDSVKYQARIEAGLKNFLDDGGFKAFTTNFEDLHGLRQLPGLAVQSLMAQGYGFGGEGDWKTSALTRIMKVMAGGIEGGTSFMEDYTYHLVLDNEKVLGAHMLEVCPSIADKKPVIDVKPLGIGGKEPPARLVFDGKEGDGIVATLTDMGDRFRMIVSDVEAIKPLHDMPNLPVARIMWKLMPDFVTATESWLLAGGAHHTVFSNALNGEIMQDLAEILGVEFIHITKDTSLPELKKELVWNDIVWRHK